MNTAISTPATFSDLRNAINAMRNEVLSNDYNRKVTGLTEANNTLDFVRAIGNLKEQTYLQQFTDKLMFDCGLLEIIMKRHAAKA